MADGVPDTGFELRTRRACVHGVDVGPVDQTEDAMRFDVRVIEGQCRERGAFRFAALVAPEMERRDLGPDPS